jgi:alpha-D-ribose 1-methylphosphonate 5-triphosphate synthase subunit PhnI
LRTHPPGEPDEGSYAVAGCQFVDLEMSHRTAGNLGRQPAGAPQDANLWLHSILIADIDYLQNLAFRSAIGYG